MFSPRSLLCVLVLLPRLLAHGADSTEALGRYNARLDEIARSYKQQFAEIRKNQRRIGVEKADSRAAERQIKELGMMRSAAITDAKLMYEKELKQSDPAPASKLSREERQRAFWTARQQLFDEGQRAFWIRVSEDEPKIAELWAAQRRAMDEQRAAFWAGLPLREAQYTELLAARRQAIGEEQTAFWAGLFEAPKQTSAESLQRAR